MNFFGQCALVIPLILQLACQAVPAAAGSGSGPAEGGLTVERGQLVREHVLTGELQAEDAHELVAPRAGVQPLEIRWLAPEGTEVKEGDRLIEFDNGSLLSNLGERRASVEQAANQLASAKSEAATAEAQALFTLEERKAAHAKAKLEADVPQELVAALEYQRKQVALKKAQLELDEAQAKLLANRKTGSADIEIQQVALRKAGVEYQRSIDGLELLTIRAPRDGIFLLGKKRNEGRPYQVGDSVWPGQTLAQLPDLSTLVVEASLFDVDDGRISVGMPVTLTLDPFPGQEISGRVQRIEQLAREADRYSSRRFFGVTVEMDELDRTKMLPGMSVRVVAADVIAEDALLLPRMSLEVDAGTSQARAILASGRREEVVLGACNDWHCELREGLEQGQTLGSRSERGP